MNDSNPIEVNTLQDQNSLAISDKSVELIVKEFIHSINQHFDEVGIHFVDTAEICRLHQEFFNDPSPTDCMSFPMDDDDDDGYKVMGDVFVCPETAIKYVQENGGDVYRETTLYLVHGLLHLIGYDDIDDADRLEMRAAEEWHLVNLESKGLLLSP